jgi:hypothetical protein
MVTARGRAAEGQNHFDFQDQAPFH